MMRRTFAAVAAVAVLVAACGGDDDTDGVEAPIDDTTDDATDDETDDGTSDDEIDGTSDDETSDDDGALRKPDVEVPDEEPTELVVTDLVEGTGAPLEPGDAMVAHYVGVLTADGSEFDESYSRGTPIEIVVGVGQVIPGWDQGLIGVKAGGRRQLDIPSELGYGEFGSGSIPPGASLTFVVDVVSIDKPPPPQTLAPTTDLTACPDPDGSNDQQRDFDEYPPTCIDVTATYAAEIETNHGTLTIELDAESAPLAVNNFVTLARFHYFDDTECHRAIPEFMVQCGDPTATGRGGPGYQFDDELPEAGAYVRGAVAMANSGPNTNGSQFFLVTGDEVDWLPPQYTLFGDVVDGLDTTLVELDALANDDPNANGVPPLEPIIIERVTITES